MGTIEEMAVAYRKFQRCVELWGFVPSEVEMEHLDSLRKLGHGEATVKVRAGQPYRLEMVLQSIDYDDAVRRRRQGLTTSP